MRPPMIFATSSGSRSRSAPIAPTASCSTRSDSTASPTRAPGRSVCCGRARARRTPRPPTCSTSRPSRHRSRSTRCPTRPCSLSLPTAGCASRFRPTAGMPTRSSPRSTRPGSTPTRSRCGSRRRARSRSTSRGTSCSTRSPRRARSWWLRGSVATTEIAPLKQRPAWAELERHYSEIADRHLSDLFAADPTRGERLTAEGAGLYLDYSKNRITDDTIDLLVGLADQSGLAERRDAMFRGEHINVSEDRAVLHVALRMPRHRSLIVDGEDVVKEVHAVLHRMAAFADRSRSGEWKGHTGKPIRNVVNIGIGGSDLGPVMAYEALRHYSRREMTFRFVSNVDGTDFAEATRDLDPAETLIVISTKTFTTLETMTNT